MKITPDHIHGTLLLFAAILLLNTAYALWQENRQLKHAIESARADQIGVRKMLDSTQKQLTKNKTP